MPVSIGDNVYFLQDYTATLANGRTYKRYAAGSTYTADTKNVDFLDAGVTAGNGYVTGGANDASVRTFLALEDVPKSYSGEGGNLVAVTMAEDGLEFVPPSVAGVSDFTDLGDVPASYAGEAGKLVAVNGTEDGLEFVAASGGGSAGGAGTPPVRVQFASSKGSHQVTFGVAPTNGNKLFVITKHNSLSQNTGWTVQDSDGGGINYTMCLTKVMGAGESTTQQPLLSSDTVSAIAAWEVSGYAGTNEIVAAVATSLASMKTFWTSAPQGPGTKGIPSALPSLKDVLNLAAIFTDGGSPQDISQMKNMFSDVLDNAGSATRFTAGHSDGDTPLAQMTAIVNTAVGGRAGIFMIRA